MIAVKIASIEIKIHLKMSGMDIKFEDEILGLLFLNSLLEYWETFKVFITNSTPNGVVSL
ncbi:hypothetical protein CR513_00348, partial [Mucuna pruriens]